MAYINREKFIKKCAKTFGNPSMTLYAINNIANECVADVEEVRHGEWIDSDPAEWECSECHYAVERWNSTPYCPNCGAKMDRGELDGRLQ